MIAKPMPRIVNPHAGRDKLKREDRCRVCGVAALPRGLTRHHIIPKGQGGDDLEANIVPLCGHGTRGCHGDVEAHRGDARFRLLERLTGEERLYVRARMAEYGRDGSEWLQRNYGRVG